MRIDKKKMRDALAALKCYSKNKNIEFRFRPGVAYCSDYLGGVMVRVPEVDFYATVSNAIAEAIGYCKDEIEVLHSGEKIIFENFAFDNLQNYSYDIEISEFDSAIVVPSPNNFMSHLRKVIYAARKDAISPELENVFVQKCGMTATDGIRLATTGYEEGEQGVLIPRYCAAVALNVHKIYPNSHVQVAEFENLILLHIGDATVFYCASQCNYPQLWSIVNTKTMPVAVVKSDVLYDAVKVVAKTMRTEERTKRVRLVFSTDEQALSILSFNSDTYSIRTKIPADIRYGYDVIVNVNYLNDVVAVLDGQVTIAITDPSRNFTNRSPLFLTDAQSCHLVMPMQM